MIAYTIRRLVYMLPILLGVALLTFCLFSVFGEDPARVSLGRHATPQGLADLRHKWGLDQPLWMQFLDFLRQIATFDYGRSFTTNRSITEMFWSGALVSLALTAPPFIIGTLLNLAFSLYLAYYRDSMFDYVSRGFLVMTLSISYLVYIVAFQYVLAFLWGWFPIHGFEQGIGMVRFLVLPWIIMMIVGLGGEIRMFRTMFLDEMGADYVRTARAKGAKEANVLFRHVLKNALIPVLTNTVVQVPFLIMGAFLMEKFFGIPGIGDMLIAAITEGDFPVLKAMTMLAAILYAVFNLITDLLYGVVDPRVQLR